MRTNEYAFDVSLACAVRVEAKSLKAAHKILREQLDCASANLGAWPNGEPILAEVSLVGSPELYEVNGEAQR